MFDRKSRLDRERHTIERMIALYCRDNHGTKGELCAECRGLLVYAMQRVDKCPYGEEKPTCAKCPIHCYKPDMREQVYRVMRYAGPRMMRHHPILALLHIVDGILRSRERR